MRSVPPLPGIRRWVAALTAAAVAATVLVFVGLADQPAFAAATDRVTGSWNMQGESQGGDGPPESRWRTGIQRILNDEGVQVAALQEAGSAPPPSATWTDRVFPEPGITEHLWNIGTRNRPDIVNIYWADPGQQRNGLAIVSRETARDAVQLPVHSQWDSRPMMGVQFGNDWYFNAHARSHGGRPNDAADIIQTARQFMANRPGEDWMVLADFNYNPGRMPADLQGHIVASNQPTQQGGHELDFAYTNHGNNNTVEAERRAINSDHFWVRYAMDPGCNPRRKRDVACDAPLPGQTYRFYARHLDGAVLTRGAPTNGDRLPPTVTRAENGNANQAVQVLFSTEPGRYLLRFNKSGGECIARVGDSVRLHPCRPHDEAQEWEFRQGSIHSPHLGPELQPSPNKLWAKLIVSTNIYQWRYQSWDGNGNVDNSDPGNGGHDPSNLRKRDIRLMPLGDSITFGVGSSDSNGYRDELYGYLKNDARNVDFVGSVKAGSMRDRDNEGHPGDRIDEIEVFADCSVPQYQPNVITLHAGTNDMNQNFRLSTAPTRLKKLINQALADSPRATVLVARLIPTGKAGLQPRIDAYNAALPGVVRDLQKEGKHVLLVDMSKVLVSDGLQNDAHPTDAGYAKMADAWYDGVLKANDKGWISTPLPEKAPTACDPGDNPIDGSDGTGSGLDSSGTALGGGWRKLGVIAPGYGQRFGRTIIAELNGDKRADYVQVAANGNFRAAINTVGKPGKPDWADVGRYDLKVDGEVRFADIDGDGRDDYLQVSPNGAVRAWRNTGGGQSSTPGKASRLNFELWGVVFTGKGFTSDHLRFADINGDGRDDILRVSDAGAAHVYVNQGSPPSGGKPAAPAWKLRLDWAGGTKGSSLKAVRFADGDGDGKADYLQVGADGAVHAFLNRGGGGNGSFQARHNWARKSGYPRPYVQFADISGDGKADYLVVYDGGAVRAWLNRGGN